MFEKRYLVFSGAYYDPNGGMNDIIGNCEHWTDIAGIINQSRFNQYMYYQNGNHWHTPMSDWYHIYDQDVRKLIVFTLGD